MSAWPAWRAFSSIWCSAYQRIVQVSRPSNQGWAGTGPRVSRIGGANRGGELLADPAQLLAQRVGGVVRAQGLRGDGALGLELLQVR